MIIRTSIYSEGSLPGRNIKRSKDDTSYWSLSTPTKTFDRDFRLILEKTTISL